MPRSSSTNPPRKTSSSSTTQKEKIAVMANNIEYIKKEVEELNKKLEHSYVNKSELEVVLHRIKLLEKIVYTTIGTIVLAFLSVLISIVFRGGI